MKLREKLVQNTRKTKGLSQEKVAHLLGISQSKYSRLENGEIDFSIRQIGLLCDALGLNPLEIIEFTQKQELLINEYIAIAANKLTPVPSTNELVRQLIKEEIDKLDKFK